MKILILAIIAMPTFVFADVTIHTNNFNTSEQSTGEHFWTRLYDWEAWSSTSEQSEVGITPNPVKSAYDTGISRVDATRLSYDDFTKVFDEYEGEALGEFYEDRQEISEDKLGSYNGLVTHAKVSLPISRSVDISNISMAEMSELIIKADSPHFHKEVSANFVSRFLDPVHSGHADVQATGIFYMSMINMSDDYYDCSKMNTSLAEKAERQGISSYDGDYRLYMINRVRELDQASISSLGSVIDSGAIRVFEQKIIYSSNLLKSGVNYFALYNTDNGPRLVMTSVLVATSQLKNYAALYLNGFSVGAAVDQKLVGGGIAFSDGVAIVGSGDIDVSSAFLSCKNGLGQGVAEYVYNLANRIAN